MTCLEVISLQSLKKNKKTLLQTFPEFCLIHQEHLERGRQPKIFRGRPTPKSCFLVCPKRQVLSFQTEIDIFIGLKLVLLCIQPLRKMAFLTTIWRIGRESFAKQLESRALITDLAAVWTSRAACCACSCRSWCCFLTSARTFGVGALISTLGNTKKGKSFECIFVWLQNVNEVKVVIGT